MAEPEASQDDEPDKKPDKRIGNQFWKVRSSHGRDPIFKTDAELWKSCLEYFDWVEDNPLWENKVTQFQGAPVDMPVAKMRAMTIGGLCIFLDICENTWANYKDKEDFLRVTKKAERIIYNQKFTGASADLLNANIIARDLGLRDSTDSKVTHSFEGMSDEDLAQKKKELERQLEGSKDD